MIGGELAGLSELVMGAILLIVILVAPGGIIGSLTRLIRPGRSTQEKVSVDKPQVVS